MSNYQVFTGSPIHNLQSSKNQRGKYTIFLICSFKFGLKLTITSGWGGEWNLSCDTEIGEQKKRKKDGLNESCVGSNGTIGYAR